MNILIAVVGDDPKDPFRQLGDLYLQRTQRLLIPKLKAIKEHKRKSKETTNLAENEEGRMLLQASTGCFRIAMDESGKEHTSVEFARVLERLLSRGKPVAFLVGGASGLSEQVLLECDQIWSLSKMTLPHRLAYCILAEQIFRAGEIMRNGPYHKA